jgi:uncharacterized protein YdaU (DUF1376 family)
MSEPYLPLYVGDYLRDTGYLTLEQHGAYVMLLMRLWSAGGSLPADENKLARIAGVTVKKWRGIWSDLSEFFELENDKISHKRITAELEKAGALRAKRAAAGAKGGASKSLKNNDATLANATARPKQIMPDQEVRKEEPKGSSKKRGCRLPADFEPDMAFATAQGLTPAQAQTETEKFRDYWNGKSGSGAVKLDWMGTWRNWVRQAVERIPAARGSPASKPLEGYTTVDRFQEESLFKACESVMGKPAPISIQRFSFPTEIVEQARRAAA